MKRDQSGQLAANLRHRLQAARLYVIVDAQLPWPRWRQRIETLIQAGADIIQLRDKRVDDRQLLDRARQLRHLTRGRATLFIMNDRVDLALLAQADGVHVGQAELRVEDLRPLTGPAPLIGVSTHSIRQARQAVAEGADYLGVGPTFPSRTKQFDRFPGIDLVRQVSAEICLPAFAIGGIGPHNLADVLAGGGQRVAVSGAIRTAEDPGAVVAQMKRILTTGHPVAPGWRATRVE